MKLSEVIKQMQEQLELNGDYHILDCEDNDILILGIEYDKELDIYHTKEKDSYRTDLYHPLSACDECCEMRNNDYVLYRNNEYDHRICIKCFFDDWEYTLYTEYAYIELEDGTRKYIMKDGNKSDYYNKYEALSMTID